MAAAKQNITLAIDKTLLKKARALAAGRGISISAMLAHQLEEMVDNDADYEWAKVRALAQMEHGFHLGGKGLEDREALHDRQSLRRFQRPED